MTKKKLMALDGVPMITSEFERIIRAQGGELIPCPNPTPATALHFAPGIPPESFLALHAEANPNIDRKNVFVRSVYGGNSYFFFGTKMAIQTTVPQNVGTLESGKMGIAENATQWFQEHKTCQSIVKGTVFALLGLVVASQIPFIEWVERTIQQTLPEWLPLYMIVKPLLIGGFAGLANWLKHNTTLPIVGARK